MSRFIDKRPNSKNKSAVNRQRFIKRFKRQIRKAVSDAVSGRSITNIEQGEKVNIPAKDISEPIFHHGQGGKRDIILPGNKDFVTGDHIKRPPSGGQGQGSQASPDGEGEDAFTFQLSREEFLDVFFEDLELPNLIRKKIVKTPAYKQVRAGFTTDGIPANINVVRSLRGALGRRIALQGPHKQKLLELREKLEKLLMTESEDSAEVRALEEEIELAQAKMLRIPYIDPIDLRYNNRVLQPKPSTQAVMFCLMDVSGSMDEAKKEIAKRFFILLYLFLTRNYETIEVVFIRHHTSAKEVDEHEFFYSRETGGTVVSSALEMMAKIIKERYPTSEWNIYGAQASDGDNWNNDSPRCKDIVMNEIMPFVQYFAYVEIMPRHHQSLWEAYLSVADIFDNFAMQNIAHQKDIYPVFRELFKRQQEHQS